MFDDYGLKSQFQYVASDFLEEFGQNFQIRESYEWEKSSLFYSIQKKFSVPSFELNTVGDVSDNYDGKNTNPAGGLIEDKNQLMHTYHCYMVYHARTSW